MRAKSKLLQAALSAMVLPGAVIIATAPEAWTQPGPFETIEKGDHSGFNYGDGASFVFNDRPS